MSNPKRDPPPFLADGWSDGLRERPEPLDAFVGLSPKPAFHRRNARRTGRRFPAVPRLGERVWPHPSLNDC